MQVILCRDIEKLGKRAICINVKDGYARNYLLPRGLALAATEGNIKKLQLEITKAKEQEEKELNRLRQLSDKIRGLSCTVVARAIDDKRLYGAVDKEDIKTALELEGVNLDIKSIILDEPIKELGVYEVAIRLHPEIETKVKVWVVKK